MEEQIFLNHCWSFYQFDHIRERKCHQSRMAAGYIHREWFLGHLEKLRTSFFSVYCSSPGVRQREGKGSWSVCSQACEVERGLLRKGEVIVEPLWSDFKSKFTLPLVKPFFNKNHKCSGFMRNFKRLRSSFWTLMNSSCLPQASTKPNLGLHNKCRVHKMKWQFKLINNMRRKENKTLKKDLSLLILSFGFQV